MAARQSASTVAPRPLPARPNLDHLKKLAKTRLKELRRNDPRARLTDAQYAIAKQYGFTSWRSMKDVIDGQSRQRDALLAAVKTGNVATLRSLLDAYPQWVDAAVEDRQTRILPTDARAMRLLHVAVAENRPEVARLLLQRGANPDARNADGRTPLHDCWELNPHRAAIRDLLMQHGAEVDAALAALIPDLDRLRELLKRDASLANDHVTNLSPLGWATVAGSADAIRLLIEHGADFRNDPGRREVMWALGATASPESLPILLDAGLDPDSRFPDGDTILHRAIRDGNSDLTAFTALLLDRGLDANAANHAGRTLLDEAIAANGTPIHDYATKKIVGHTRYDDLIALLRRRGGGRGNMDNASLPPAVLKAFGEAIYRDRGDTAAVRKMLKEHPRLVNSRPWAPRQDMTPLEAVAGMCVWHRPKMHQIAQLLVERGAEADLPTLARCGLVEQVRQRLNNDPSLTDKPDVKGRTALYRAACVYGHFPEGEAVAKLLIERGATVDIYCAATLGMVERVQELLAADPSLARTCDGDGMTALHWAVRQRKDEDKAAPIARLLLDAGADVEAVDQQQDGMHPLHHCGEWGAVTAEMADLLIERGADINARAARNGWTPLDYAIDRNRTRMIEYFRARGGKPAAEIDDPDDEAAARFLKAVWDGDADAVRAMLAERPGLVEATAPHPQWDGRPQALHLAIERGDRAMFDLLLERGAEAGGRNALYDHWSPLMLAIHWKRDAMRDELLGHVHHVSLIDALMMGDDETALRIMQWGQIMLQRPMPNGATMLHFATTVPAAERLLELGVPLDAKDRHGQTALDRASERKLRELVQFLLRRGAEGGPVAYARLGDMERLKRAVGRGRKLDPRLIQAAVRGGHGDAVRWLLSRGADVSAREVDQSGATLLHIAAWEGDLEMVKLLVLAGADLHAVDEEHKATPLGWAQTARRITGNEACDAVAAYLEEAMADVKPKRVAKKAAKPDWKPIMDAAFTGDVERARKLLDVGANPNVLSPTNHRHRPLHRAIERKKTSPRNERHEAVVKLLLEHGADPKLRGTHGQHTALQLAAIDSPRFVPLLLGRFKPLDIWHACVVLDEQRVAGLLKKDRSLATKRDENEWTPLHYVAASGMFAAKAQAGKAQLSITRMLLDAGADVNATYGYQGRWPIPVLFYACGYHDNPALMELLLQRGADPCDNESVYHASDEMHEACLAVIEKHVPRRRLAAECTKCLRTQMRWGRTRGRKWLLAHGADPSAPGDDLGSTALHWAAKNGAGAPVITALLDHGADPSIRNKAGKTPLDLARSAGKKRVVAQLQTPQTPGGERSRS